MLYVIGNASTPNQMLIAPSSTVTPPQARVMPAIRHRLIPRIYTERHERSAMTDDPTPHFGELLIAAVLAVIAWICKTFAGRHIESMDKLTDKIDGLSKDVAEMKGDIKALSTRTDLLERQVEHK